MTVVARCPSTGPTSAVPSVADTTVYDPLSKQARIAVIPITLPVANGYIERWHRHHAPLVTVINGHRRTNKGFAWVALAAVAEEEIVGVAVLGRPPNRYSDDGQTIELLRLATDGTPNACSALLGASARTAKAMGASQIITYTLETETGISLRAAGWNRDRDGISSSWTKGRGKARNKRGGNTIWRPHMEIDKVRWSKTFRDPIQVDTSREGLKEYAASLVADEPEHPTLW
jgi:hypothetical protein